MASIQSILNKIASMANRTGLFSIQKNEFFDTLTDITNKVKEVNDNVNSVAKSLIWQNPVANFSALATTYPNAVQGWAAMVTSLGYVYSWNGVAWKDTGLKAFPADVAVKSELIKGWVISESYEINDIISDTNGNITSAVIKWPDGDVGSISDVALGAHGITAARYNRSIPGIYATTNISYSVSGEVTGQEVVLTGF